MNMVYLYQIEYIWNQLIRFWNQFIVFAWNSPKLFLSSMELRCAAASRQSLVVSRDNLGSIAGAVPRRGYSSKMASSGRKCVRYVTVGYLPSKSSAVMRTAKSTDALNS
jgi:hypothetical protein